MKNPDPIIHVAHLSKIYNHPVEASNKREFIRRLLSNKYSQIHAVEDVSFDIYSGEVVGFIGKNGAGKSTIIKMLTGIITPSSGVIEIAGTNPRKNRRKNALQIGVVFGQRTQLWHDLTVESSFNIIKNIYGIDSDLYYSRLNDLKLLLSLDSIMARQVRLLSLGERVKADIAASLLHFPRILYLDEPTIGLDIISRQKIRSFISQIGPRFGTTVILTSHDMEDIDTLCERVIIFDSGKVLYDGSLRNLRVRHSTPNYLILVPNSNTDPYSIHVEGTNSTVQNGEVIISYDSNNFSAGSLIKTVLDSWDIKDIQVKQSSLSDIIQHVYESC